MKQIVKISLLVCLFFTFSVGISLGDSMEHSVGLGLGLPYGGLGVNYEAGVCDFFAPTIGLGVLPDNIGWNLGGRFYFPGRGEKLRGRATLLYGTNVLLEKRYSNGDSDYDTDEGISFGLGLNWRFHKEWAFDADLLFVTTDIPDNYDQEGGDLTFAFGFSRRW